LKQFPERARWQTHISKCIPEYIESLENKGSLLCLHFLCYAVLDSESDFWHHLRDIYSIPKPDTKRKRQHQWDKDEDKQVKRKRSCFEEGKDPKAICGRKSAPKSRSLSRIFVNVSAMDFCPG